MRGLCCCLPAGVGHRLHPHQQPGWLPRNLSLTHPPTHHHPPAHPQVIGRMEADEKGEWSDVVFVPARSVAAAAEPAKKK